jgi:hypothetical protein
LKYCVLTIETKEIPSPDPVDQAGEDDWDTVGGATERSLSPAPTVEEVVPKSAQQATSTGDRRAAGADRR